jgi:hypothetical protein
VKIDCYKTIANCFEQIRERSELLLAQGSSALVLKESIPLLQLKQTQSDQNDEPSEFYRSICHFRRFRKKNVASNAQWGGENYQSHFRLQCIVTPYYWSKFCLLHPASQANSPNSHGA